MRLLLQIITGEAAQIEHRRAILRKDAPAHAIAACFEISNQMTELDDERTTVYLEAVIRRKHAFEPPFCLLFFPTFRILLKRLEFLGDIAVQFIEPGDLYLLS